MRLLKTTAFTQTTEEYASRSSIHGIGYIFDRELGIFDRVLWLLVVFFFLGVAGALTGNLWTQWRDEQVVTTLKNTTKLVTDVPFPALTLCGSGLHMSTVEKKLVEDFKTWRARKNHNETTEEEVKNDMKNFMQEGFQIKQDLKGEQEISILDILDMMISPNISSTIAATHVRENAIACKSSEHGTDSLVCPYSCSHPDFHVLGARCFFVSPGRADWPTAIARCKEMNAELASLSSSQEEALVEKLSGGSGNIWIGIYNENLNANEKWVWLDGSNYTYRNWSPDRPDQRFGNMVQKTFGNERNGTWGNFVKTAQRKYACSMAAEAPCDSAAIRNMLHMPSCIEHELNSRKEQVSSLPAIDVFLNPDRVQEKETVIQRKVEIAKNYFTEVDMKILYPKLFRILWESTLPCFKEEHMLLSCMVAGVHVDCSDYFTRVPTDAGMCCALNVESSLRTSEYSDLVKEMQGNKTTEKVKSQEGKRNGLKLMIDLHSNTVALGTLDQQHNTFKMFIGEPDQFPMMQDKSIHLQPGREHFVDLSAKVVTTNDIKHISPEARGCLFNDESDLEFYKRYTYSNCRLECRIKAAEEKLNCIPWHLPKGKNSTSCDPWTSRYFMEEMQKSSAQCHHCLSDCDHITYLPTVTSAELSSCDSRNLNLSPFCDLSLTSLAMWQPSVLKTYGNQTKDYVIKTSGPLRKKYPNYMDDRELITSLTQGEPYYNAYERDIAIVNIFFGEPTVYEFERSPKMTWLDFISGFGGLCGLCLGISFVSVAEIIYWFSIRLCRKF